MQRAISVGQQMPVGQLRPEDSQEQTAFGAEEPIQQPVELPEDVLKILRHDPRNKTCLASGQSEELMPATWFVAANVKLNNDSFADLVVMAANPCLQGANVVPFWIFRGTSGKSLLVLSARGLGLKVLRTRSKGQRDIRVTAATARLQDTTLYKFSRRKYEARSHSRKSL